MKNYVLISMLLMLISFSVFINPLEGIEDHSFSSKDEMVISAIDTITDADAITESVPTIIEKWQIESRFPSKNAAHDLRGKSIPIRFINHVICTAKVTGFISVVHHQSNYLS